MSDPLTLRTVEDMRSIDRAVWDGLANPGYRIGPGGIERTSETESAGGYNPFVCHDFLSALEESGSVGGGTGWQPAHLILEAAGGRIIGAAPAYLKAHSMGEYVFDHGWADAYERAGGRYFPKLLAAVPFTPVTGPRLLAADEAARAGLAEGLKQVVARYRLSSGHVTFAGEADIAAMAERGYLMRLDQQFHFTNAGYGSFEDCLGALASRKRKALKRERRDALANGISIAWLTGRDLREEHWDAFFAFYIDTGGRKWGRPYLTRRFFSLIGERMADRILLVMARREGRWIAGALNFIGSDRIYGRNWGCIEDHPFLHFEVCYHQAIDFAIAKGLSVVEAGAQGEHKLARGYLPVTTRSAHYIPDPGFRRAVADYLTRERAAVAQMGEALTEAGPFRRAGGGDEDG